MHSFHFVLKHEGSQTFFWTFNGEMNQDVQTLSCNTVCI